MGNSWTRIPFHGSLDGQMGMGDLSPAKNIYIYIYCIYSIGKTENTSQVEEPRRRRVLSRKSDCTSPQQALGSKSPTERKRRHGRYIKNERKARASAKSTQDLLRSPPHSTLFQLHTRSSTFNRSFLTPRPLIVYRSNERQARRPRESIIIFTECLLTRCDLA